MSSERPPRAIVPPTPFIEWPLALAGILAAAVLVADFWAPLGSGIGMLYVIPLLVVTLSGPPRFQLVAAGAASILAMLRPLLSDGSLTGIVITNRAIALTIIWGTTLVLARFRRTWIDLQARTKELADLNYALDQSAIVATTDTAGTITYVNDKFCEISKYSREELLGQDHRLISSKYHPEEFIRSLWVTIANGQIWRGELRNRAKDGAIYWVDTTIVPFLDERGKPFQYTAIRYEITERKRTEELLREQATLARLGQLAAVVAHEVKNPIAGIRGALQVIASRMPPGSGDRAVVGDIIIRLDALNRVVEDLLVFARPRPLQLQSTDLATLVRNTAELIGRDPSLTGLRVIVADTRAVVSADSEQLQIVFQNVLMNAAQAMGGSGDVTVDIRQTPVGWTIAFIDQGPGMLPEVKKNAFEAFFTTKHRGTGLGLPTARRIIEAHGGVVEIETPSAGGTIILISLPAGR